MECHKLKAVPNVQFTWHHWLELCYTYQQESNEAQEPGDPELTELFKSAGFDNRHQKVDLTVWESCSETGIRSEVLELFPPSTQIECFSIIKCHKQDQPSPFSHSTIISQELTFLMDIGIICPQTYPRQVPQLSWAMFSCILLASIRDCLP